MASSETADRAADAAADAADAAAAATDANQEDIEKEKWRVRAADEVRRGIQSAASGSGGGRDAEDVDGCVA